MLPFCNDSSKPPVKQTVKHAIDALTIGNSLQCREMWRCGLANSRNRMSLSTWLHLFGRNRRRIVVWRTCEAWTATLLPHRARATPERAGSGAETCAPRLCQKADALDYRHARDMPDIPRGGDDHGDGAKTRKCRDGVQASG